MQIGVIGGGRVGNALAASWRKRGHDVTVSTRETVAETVASGDIVVLSVPARAAADALASASLDGKVLVDATNNVGGGPAGLEIAALVPGARYVKAFNTVFATFMNKTPPADRAALVYCGDDAEAKAAVASLIEELGFEPVDAGGASVTPLVEAFGKLLIGIAYRQGRGAFVYRFEER